MFNKGARWCGPRSTPIIGIDLGTIFSCVGIMRNDRVDSVPEDYSGNILIPSTVCFTPTKTLIGTEAKKKMMEYPESSMFESKRLIGNNYSNPNVQEDIKRWPLKIIADPITKKPKYVVKVKDKNLEYFPEEASTMILEYLKKQAEIYNANKEIKRAVITVPAHFNNLQRQATIEAANKAGLEVIKY